MKKQINSTVINNAPEHKSFVVILIETKQLDVIAGGEAVIKDARMRSSKQSSHSLLFFGWEEFDGGSENRALEVDLADSAISLKSSSPECFLNVYDLLMALGVSA